MIIILTGDGKGKTTSAIGHAIRALGGGRKVAIFHFIKSPAWKTGEDAMLGWIQEWFGEHLLHEKRGKGFVGILGDSLPREEHASAAETAFEEVQKIIEEGKYHTIILDEINVAVSLGLIAKEKVTELLQTLPEEIDLILTGRSAHEDHIALAHLVTECREIKHPYQKGQKARKGVEY
ncbi:MAG: cob(I)yrinic acid a,c-diamide adenosyltransferase [bacterium]|nr:cob(I)yrinic acid a,c-diamide adenosyltransferase [bacterium]